MSIDLRLPFRGSDAVAAGLVTAKMLRGPRFRRLFTGIYVAADVEVDLELRSRAAYLLVEGRGVLGGWSAAELLDASCGPDGAPAEVVVPGARRTGRPGLVVRGDLLLPDEIQTVCGVAVTGPLRTAFDLACRTSLLDAVIALDAIAHRFEFEPAELLVFARRHLGARGSGRLPEIVRRSDRLSDSPMETRIRMAIEDAGLVVPVLQYPVGPYALDMAYPGIKLGIEYDGREHLTQERAMRDLVRQAFITREGWDVLRFRAVDVLRRPSWVAGCVQGALVSAGRARGLLPTELDLLKIRPRSS
jgi:very-short-patch-repair endonuclease